MRKSSAAIAARDIAAAVKSYSLVGMLGWQDIRQRYRRSAIGPFWLTISMGVLIGSIGIVFGKIFQSPLSEFLPFLTVGIVLWSFITSVVTEGCAGFIASEGIIKQLPIPMFVHILRMLWRNLLIFAHNIVIFPLVLLAVGRPLSWLAMLSLVGLAVTVINLAWLSTILSVVCARYRDLSQIVANAIQVMFYITPIMWMPTQLPSDTGHYLLNFNPAYHLVELVRAPLLGDFPTPLNWEVSIASAVAGWTAVLLVFGRFKRRIPYWL